MGIFDIYIIADRDEEHLVFFAEIHFDIKFK